MRVHESKTCVVGRADECAGSNAFLTQAVESYARGRMQALWTVALPEDASPWFVVGGQAVLVAAGRKVFAIDLENGAASPRRVRALERPRPSWRAEGDDAGGVKDAGVLPTMEESSQTH